MSDTRSIFSTVGAAAPDAVNDHPTLRFEHVTPERVVNADVGARLWLHGLCLEAGATQRAAELERWMPTEQLEQLESAQLVELDRVAVTSEFAARCCAQLRWRADRLLEDRRAARMLHEASDVRRLADAAYGDLEPRSRELATRRMIASHTIGARIAPTDLRHEHAPIAERVRVIARPELGFIELRGWLVGSCADLAGRAGALSLVKLPGQPVPLVVGTHETRLGWGS
jgi:hypothetical protein